ncbi:MAG: threonine/serine exporter family protein, partial [Lachnospiraceae bacterium]|nr:threonine/serine exporter family protein [Lachnospiraceae bacterium]
MNKKTPPSAESCSSSESAFSGSASIHHERSPFERSVLEVASRAGSILVESGAEISRVEETIERICRHYGVQSEHAYVLSNGIFLAAGSR